MKRAKCTSRPHNKAFLRTCIHKNEKASPERLACLVEQALEISNGFIDGFIAVIRFNESFS